MLVVRFLLRLSKVQRSWLWFSCVDAVCISSQARQPVGFFYAVASLSTFHFKNNRELLIATLTDNLHQCI
jgi:hypothetical protein